MKDGKPVVDSHAIMGRIHGKLVAEAYAYTDPDCLGHWREANRNLRRGGVQGVCYDYPDQAFAARGGQEDRYATATAAYRTLYRVARQELGKEAWLQERIGPGSDATVEFVSSVRTAGDNNVLIPDILELTAMRWYKNRRLTSSDMDGKSLLANGNGNIHRLSALQRRAALTVSDAVTGHLLLTESFRLFDQQVLHDLSRVFPFHATPLPARPLDAFVRAGEPSELDHNLNHLDGGDAFVRAGEPSGSSNSRPGVDDFGQRPTNHSQGTRHRTSRLPENTKHETSIGRPVRLSPQPPPRAPHRRDSLHPTSHRQPEAPSRDPVIRGSPFPIHPNNRPPTPRRGGHAKQKEVASPVGAGNMPAVPAIKPRCASLPAPPERSIPPATSTKAVRLTPPR